MDDSRFNSPAYLSAKYVVFLGEMFATKYIGGKYEPAEDRLDFLGVGVLMEDPGDIEYRYVVECNNLYNKVLPVIRCESPDGKEVFEIPDKKE